MATGRGKLASQTAKESPEFIRAQRRLGRRAKELRLERGLTLEQAAERGDLDLKHLQKYEAGQINVTLVTLVRVAKGLKVDLAELFAVPGRAPLVKRKRTHAGKPS